jgi:hypothetical protein
VRASGRVYRVRHATISNAHPFEGPRYATAAVPIGAATCRRSPPRSMSASRRDREHRCLRDAAQASDRSAPALTIPHQHSPFTLLPTVADVRIAPVTAKNVRTPYLRDGPSLPGTSGASQQLSGGRSAIARRHDRVPESADCSWRSKRALGRTRHSCRRSSVRARGSAG